jgi:hypothetical protein
MSRPFYKGLFSWISFLTLLNADDCDIVILNFLRTCPDIQDFLMPHSKKSIALVFMIWLCHCEVTISSPVSITPLSDADRVLE